VTEPDSHVHETANDFWLSLVEEGLKHTHLFRDGPSILDLCLLGVHSPWEEGEGGVHLFGLGEERTGHFDHCLVGLLGGQDIEAKIALEMMLAVLAGEFLLLERVFSSWCGVCRGNSGTVGGILHLLTGFFGGCFLRDVRVFNC